MAERKVITIKVDELSTISLARKRHKPRGEEGYERWTNVVVSLIDKNTGEPAGHWDSCEDWEKWNERTERVVSMHEAEILKKASIAAEELERAEERLEVARERHEALKTFVQRLYPVPSLTVVNQ